METDYYNDEFEPPYSLSDCRRQLMNDFAEIYGFDIRSIVKFHGGKYAKAHKALSIVRAELKKPSQDSQEKHVTVELQNEHGYKQDFQVSKMSRKRPVQKSYKTPVLLRPEVNFVKEQAIMHVSESAGVSIKAVSPVSIAEVSNTISCHCCFASCDFEMMAQCEEGHLVCVDCFKSYVQEKLFGGGKIKLVCMASECSSVYPGSELQRCLEPKVWSKYEERVMEENLNMAGVARELIRCSSCDFAALLSPSVKMFRCLREDCQKAVCRDCGIDWNSHVGLDCKEVENKEESLRLEYEEKMTKAKVRTCESCNTQFTKEGGCNKIICRCGATMCYICRTSKINYSHFCNHPRDPGNGCNVCSACSLWTNPEEDEKRAIQEIKNEAMSKRRVLGYNDIKVIGVPDELAAAEKHDEAKMMNQPNQNLHQQLNHQQLQAQVPVENRNPNLRPPMQNRLPGHDQNPNWRQPMQNWLPDHNINPNWRPPMQNWLPDHALHRNWRPPMQNWLPDHALNRNWRPPMQNWLPDHGLNRNWRPPMQNWLPDRDLNPNQRPPMQNWLPDRDLNPN